MARLKARGYPVVNPDQSPNDIAGGDGKKGSAVLGEIFRVRDGHPGKPGGKGRTAAPD